MAKVRLEVEIDAQGNISGIDAAGASLGKTEKAAAKTAAQLAAVKGNIDKVGSSTGLTGLAKTAEEARAKLEAAKKSGTATAEELARLEHNAEALSGALARTGEGGKKAGKGLSDAEKAAKRTADQLRRTKAAADQLSTTMMVGGAAMVGFGAYTVHAASNLEEARNKAAVVFGPKAQAEMQQWAAGGARAFGMSQRAALESAGTIGNLFTAMGMGQDAAAGMSRDTVQLAGDLASFNNIKPEEALEKLRAGLVGEIEPLRSLGVSFLDVDVRAQAVKMGLAATTKEVSEGAKVQARYALILQQTNNAQGDFARTADGAANSERTLKASVEDSTAAIGKGLKPAYEDLLHAAVPVAEVIGKIAESPLGPVLIQGAMAAGALALGLGGAYKVIMAVHASQQALNLVTAWFRGHTVANTVALMRETGALEANTAAQGANATAAAASGAARGAGGGIPVPRGPGWGGAVGRGLAIAGGALVAGGIGVAAGSAAGRSRSTLAQAGYGGGAVLGGAASGAAAGSVVPGIGTAVGAVGGGIIGAGSGLYTMRAETRAEARSYREAANAAAEHQKMLRQMTAEERRAYIQRGIIPARMRESLRVLGDASDRASDSLAGHSLTTSADKAALSLDDLSTELLRTMEKVELLGPVALSGVRAALEQRGEMPITGASGARTSYQLKQAGMTETPEAWVARMGAEHPVDVSSYYQARYLGGGMAAPGRGAMAPAPPVRTGRTSRGPAEMMESMIPTPAQGGRAGGAPIQVQVQAPEVRVFFGEREWRHVAREESYEAIEATVKP